MHGYPPQPPQPPQFRQQPPKHQVNPKMLGCLGAFVLLLIAGAIGNLLDGGNGTTPTSASAPARIATATSTSPTRTPEVYEYVEAGRTVVFTRALTAIDPGLTVHPSRHLRRAAEVCYDLYGGEFTAAKLLYRTAYRYNGGNANVPQGSAKARRIYAAVMKWICTSPGLREHYRTTRKQSPSAAPKKATPKPTPRPSTRTSSSRPAAPKPPSLPAVRPGAFCSPAGAQGIYNGTIYTCKGPGQPRWRR